MHKHYLWQRLRVRLNRLQRRRLLRQADAAYAADVERLRDLDDGQLRYLDQLDEVADPLTDRIEHEHG